jgi:large subunit ribosomal protein L33
LWLFFESKVNIFWLSFVTSGEIYNFAAPKWIGDKLMAKKAKDQRIQVILECTEQKGSGVPGMSRYITTKSKKNTPERLELKKYNPYLKKMTLHKEIK